MEKNKRNKQIDILLLAVLAHIRFLLKCAGIELPHGIILFSANEHEQCSTIRHLKEFGAVECQLRGNAIPWYPNDKMVIVPFQKYYKEGIMTRFLACEEYLPVIAVSGVLPDYLQAYENIVMLKATDFNVDVEGKGLYDNIISIIHKNAKRIQEIVDYSRATDILLQNDSKNMLQSSLEMTAIIIECLYHQNNENDEMYCSKEEFQQCIEEMCRVSGAFSEDCDVCSILRTNIYSFVDENDDIRIGGTDQIEGELGRALRDKRAILYDEKFYYISDELLKQASAEILKTISYPMLKMMLWKEGVISCNQVSEGNYTIKKLLFTAYGETMRPRFIKIKREMIDMGGELDLTERRKNEY